VNMAIGQGDLLVTPLQLAVLYAAIANGGTLYKPHIAKKILSPSGRVVHRFEPEKKAHLPVSRRIIRFIQKNLRGVVSRGTAWAAFKNFPIPVAGKTGTAEVKGKDDFAWFVGYAPANKPRYVVVVLVEQGGHGGSIAAPAVRKILADIFQISEKTPLSVRDLSR
jgi:penicillin-binding protein 2